MQAARVRQVFSNMHQEPSHRLRRAVRSCLEPLESGTLMAASGVAANAPPVVTPPGLLDVSVNEDAPNTLVDLWAAFQDAEDQDADLTYTVTENTNAALFRAVSVDAATGRLVLNYTPERQRHGQHHRPRHRPWHHRQPRGVRGRHLRRDAWRRSTTRRRSRRAPTSPWARTPARKP